MTDASRIPDASDRTALGERVISVIARSQELDAAEINLDQTFEQLGLDSLDGFDILFALEEEFDISIPDEAARDISCLQDLVDRLGEALSGEATSASPTDSAVDGKVGKYPEPA